MKRFSSAPLLGASIIALCSLLAACGGGGGGGGTTPPVNNPGGGSGGGSGSPSPGSTSTPTPGSTATPTPGASGTITIGNNAVGNAIVAFTCGCTGQAGQVTADASGNYTINVPAAGFGGTGSYTPAGHNLMVIGYAPGAHAQAWTMEFFGATPAHNLNLDGTATGNASDVYSTAAALYVYNQTIAYYKSNPPANPSDNTYDVWNFNNVIALKAHFKTSPNAAESKLISDITAAQNAGQSLYPVVPNWDKTSGDGANATILADLNAVVASKDSALPAPCGTSCTGAPTP